MFGSYYLSSLQQGLQSAHCIADMFVKYQQSTKEEFLFNWAENHKTIIILNGGNSQELFDLYERFRDIDHPYPFGAFNEDIQSLNGAMTCVGIILPEPVYTLASSLKTPTEYVDPWAANTALYNVELARIIQPYRLAH